MSLYQSARLFSPAALWLGLDSWDMVASNNQALLNTTL
jgi:hypothetical protein